MALESRELLIDDVKIYSTGLINALKQDKLVEARGYLSDLKNSLDPISKYLEAQISFDQKGVSADIDPMDLARSEGDRAVLAAKRAEEKAERLERIAKETSEESKRLKKAARKAKKDAGKAWKAAEKAERAERKVAAETRQASEHASKANQAARHS